MNDKGQLCATCSSFMFIFIFDFIFDFFSMLSMLQKFSPKTVGLSMSAGPFKPDSARVPRTGELSRRANVLPCEHGSMPVALRGSTLTLASLGHSLEAL